MVTQANVTMPEQHQIFAAIDGTWPPASVRQVDGWTIREGKGGGSRVSAATGAGDVTVAERAMASLGQTPLFMIRDTDTALDDRLHGLRYEAFDPVTVYATAASALVGLPAPDLAGIPGEIPLSIQREIWASGGIGPARLAVMDRAKGPKCYLVVRNNDRPVGTAFVAIHKGIAMLHALEILPDFRRMGAGRAATIMGATWAVDHGAQLFALLATKANLAAGALYLGLGMQPVAHYHYRRPARPDSTL